MFSTPGHSPEAVRPDKTGRLSLDMWVYPSFIDASITMRGAAQQVGQKQLKGMGSSQGCASLDKHEQGITSLNMVFVWGKWLSAYQVKFEDGQI